MACGLLPGQLLRCLREASESIPLGPQCLSSKLKSLIAAQTEALEAEQERVEVINSLPTCRIPSKASDRPRPLKVQRAARLCLPAITWREGADSLLSTGSSGLLSSALKI